MWLSVVTGREGVGWGTDVVAPCTNIISLEYTPRNAKVAASLLQAFYLAGCVCIACSGLILTSLDVS